MAGSKTDAFETRLLNLVFKNTGATLAAMANNWVGLFTVVPSDSSAGTEVTGSSYARKQTAPADWTLTSGQVTNATELLHPAVTTTPYTVVGWGIFDASTSGNLLYWGDTTSTAMAVGDIPRWAIGAIVITED